MTNQLCNPKTELRATDDLKSDLKDMRHKLNLLEEEINKIEKIASIIRDVAC